MILDSSYGVQATEMKGKLQLVGGVLTTMVWALAAVMTFLEVEEKNSRCLECGEGERSVYQLQRQIVISHGHPPVLPLAHQRHPYPAVSLRCEEENEEAMYRRPSYHRLSGLLNHK